MNLMRICIGTSDLAPGPFYSYDDLPGGQEDPGFCLHREGSRVCASGSQSGSTHQPRAAVFRGALDPAPMDENQRPLWRRFAAAGGHPHFSPSTSCGSSRRTAGKASRSTPSRSRTNPEFGWRPTRAVDGRRSSSGTSSATIWVPFSRPAGAPHDIWAFDHNFNNPEFPATILRDPAAARHVEGSGFHLYEGKPRAMSRLHREFPASPLTSPRVRSTGPREPGDDRVLPQLGTQLTLPWAKRPIDHQGKPNVSRLSLSAIPRSSCCNRTPGDRVSVRLLPLRPVHEVHPADAARIASSSGTPANVAFRNPDGTLVLIVGPSRADGPGGWG